MEKSTNTPDEIAPPVIDEDLGHTVKFSGAVQDQGAALFQEVQEYSPEELEAESAKVLRLIDWHIMPIVRYYGLNTLHPEYCAESILDLRHIYHTISR